MFYQWLVSLTSEYSFLNVFRYITFRTFISFFTAFFAGVFVGPLYIRKLKELAYGQSIRDDGPQMHKKKAGTPTMGGGIILIAAMLPFLLWVDLMNPLCWALLTVSLGFGAVGFVDDYLKISKKNTKGLPGKVRLCAEFLIAGVTVSVLIYFHQFSTMLAFPFFKNLSFDLGWWYVGFASLVIVGTANAVNLTDGLDGLAIVPIMIVSTTLGLFCYIAGHLAIAQYLQIPHVVGAGELVPIVGAMIAGSMAFLWFNSYPAQVFMGDVGSLSLGGFIGTLAVITKNEILMLVLGGVFVVEALSVIAQVLSFKTTGKRVLKMAPLHHHYELQGMTETKIIVRFWIVSILLAVLSLATLKLR